jgi:hypothetical protein
LTRALAPDWWQQSSERKDAPSAISTDVKNLWKADFSLPLYHFLGLRGLAAPNRLLCP